MIAGKYAEMFRLGVRNMWGYRLRSFLTVLGISVGIAAVIAMVALGQGAQEELLAQYGRLGIRNIIVSSVKPSDEDQGSAGQTSWVARYGLTRRDYRQIRATVRSAVSVLPVHTHADRIWEGSRSVDARIHGVLPEQMRLFRLDVVRGRPLTAMDNIRLNQVCVVRPGLLRALHYYGPALGHHLQVGDEYYEIVGVLREEEFTGLTRKALNADPRSLELYAPYETVIKRHGTMSFVRKSGSFQATDVELHQIVVETDDQENVLTTARMIERILQSFHRRRDYEMIVPLEFLAQRRKTQEVFNRFLLLIAGISLLVGGIGIANIMLASITERTREIGIRRAMGAKKRHILAQFLTETVTLAGVGGVFGYVLGVLVFSPLLEMWTEWTTIVPSWAVPLAIGISFLVGVLAGIWPATRAARTDPIHALHYE